MVVIISTDPGGSKQRSRFWVRWKDYRDAEGRPTEGVYAKTLVRFTEPFDMRNTGFLMIVTESGDSEQFVYRPSDRKVRRVNMKDVSVMGTDFSLDDFAFRDVDDAEYRRLSDEVIDGTPVFVVEAEIKPGVESPYSRTRSYLEKEHYIPLRSRFWDRAGVEVKEMRTTRGDVERFGKIFIPTKLTMRHLLHESFTTLEITNLVPNPALPESAFEVRRLESH